MSAKWIDYSGARPNLHRAKAEGAVGVLRYLSEPVPATLWKRISIAEKDDILAAGLDLILNWEWYEGRMLEGGSAGLNDGFQALKQAEALGYPKGATIFFSHDTGTRDDVRVLSYLRGAQRGLGASYKADIYSGYDTVEMALNHGVAQYGWQTLAWSNGRVGNAHLYQNGKQWFSGGADENIVLHQQLGSWLQTLQVAKPIPTPKPKPKPTPRPPTPTPRPTPKPPVKPVVRHDSYTVRKGDTLADIARSHATTVMELLRLNPVLKRHPDRIFPGQVVDLPQLGGRVSPTPVKVYRIVSGDTLAIVAKKFHTTVPHLMKWNKALIKNPNVIHTGWVIRVR